MLVWMLKSSGKATKGGGKPVGFQPLRLARTRVVASNERRASGPISKKSRVILKDHLDSSLPVCGVSMGLLLLLLKREDKFSRC
jgi:hypothetical protein